MTAAIRLLRQEKRYFRLFMAGVVNGVGDRFSQVALLALLLRFTESGLAVGAVLAIRVLPFLVVGPLGGFLADRFSRKKILIITDLSRILFAVSFAWVNDESMLWLVYLSTFALAAGEAIYAPARKSFIPLLVREENIIKVNSLEQVLLGIVLIGGSLSGGIVTFFFGADMTFWINGLSFLAAAMIVLPLSFTNQSYDESNRNKEAKQLSLWRSLHLIKSVMTVSSSFCIAVLLEFLFPLFNGIDNVLVSVYAVQEFQLGDIGIGLFYGGLGIGLMLSFIAAERLQQHLLLIGFIAIVAEGILLIILSHVHYAVSAFMMYILISFSSGICNTCFDSIIMKETPRHIQGFTFGLLTTISNTLIGISMFAAGFMLEVVSNRTLGFIGGAGYIVTALCLYGVYVARKNAVPFSRKVE
ncbi:MFS transporter [Priestia megaterium]|nr:MFS transporter [Priestia megaterium]